MNKLFISINRLKTIFTIDTELWTYKQPLNGPSLIQNLHENFIEVGVTKVNVGLHLSSVNVTWLPCPHSKKKKVYTTSDLHH